MNLMRFQQLKNQKIMDHRKNYIRSLIKVLDQEFNYRNPNVETDFYEPFRIVERELTYPSLIPTVINAVNKLALLSIINFNEEEKSLLRNLIIKKAKEYLLSDSYKDTNIVDLVEEIAQQVFNSLK